MYVVDVGINCSRCGKLHGDCCSSRLSSATKNIVTIYNLYLSKQMWKSDSDRAKKLWDEWNVRCAVLISLFFQIVLTFLAKSRKRRGSVVLTGVIWSCYLLADWIAAFAVGLISSGQTDDCPEKNAVNKQMAAFWAPFLLLHLGGPDSITAFSLEDNELWIRHWLGLIIQLVAVVYVFLQSLPNEYWIPTLVMFLAGACKYVERTVALYQACLGNFKASLLSKPDPGPNYAQLMQEYAALEASEVPVKIDIVKEPEKGTSSGITSSNMPESLKYIDIVLKGYGFFDTYKGLIVDDMFSFHERNESRKFFFNRTARDAFTVMEVELNFIYDTLYTKMAVVHTKIGYLSRLLGITLTVVCFQQFASLSQHEMVRFDRVVTYVLLSGAVCLDLVNLFNLVFSDWTIISAKRWVSALIIKLPFGKRSCRWSNTMFQHSFISFCLKERFSWLDKIANFPRIKVILDEFLYKNKTAFREDLKEFIFEELKSKAEEAESKKIAKEIYSARGDWVLSKYPSHYPYPSISSSLSEEAEYDESLLLWHIATELCYFESSGSESCGDPKREFCKVLSDYMLYLLVMKPTLMSAVAGIAQIRYQDTCAEAKKFFRKKNWEPQMACAKLLDVKTVVKPSEVKGDRSKSLLFDACILANDLKKLKNDRRWEMMSRVWVELLSFAASHCRPDVHARQLSQGGELITFVWLLMVHFGLGEQFRIEAGHARAKLIIQK